MKLSDILKNFRTAQRLTMEEFAERCGVSKGYISRLENETPQKNTGKVSIPSLTTLKKLAGGMSISLDELMRRMDDEEMIEISDSPTLPNYPGIELIPPTKKIPMLGAIACGQPIYTNREYTYIDGPIKADFCLRAQGDSMTGARIRDGDLVFCRKQEMVDDGEIAAVVIGDEATLKRFYYYPDKSLVILKAENPDYPDQLYIGPEIDEIEVLGKAIAFQSVI